MSNVSYDDYLVAFRHKIVDPLESSLNKTLHHLNYWVLENKIAEFQLDGLSKSGLFGVSMIFDDKVLEIFPEWYGALRDGNAYHISTLVTSKNDISNLSLQEPPFAKISGSQSNPWVYVLNETLLSVSVDGMGRSPQSITFSFPSGKSIVVLGDWYTGKPLAGDADELLIVSEEQFLKTERIFDEPWNNIWDSENPSKIM